MAHEGGGGGGKKKPSFLRSCLTSTVALIVGVYVIVLLGSAAITTFFKNRNDNAFSLSAAVVQPTPAPQPPTVLASQTPVAIAPENGSNSTGGVGNGSAQSFVPSNPSIGPIQVTSGGPYYIVEQGDLTQNGQILSFDDSMNMIAAKLLTTVAALEQYNAALSSGALAAGQVLIVPPDVVSGGGGGNLPPTGEYASP